MDLHWLKPLLGRPSPFTTVYLDATRAGATGEAEAADRWKAVRRSLERDGASAGVLDEIARAGRPSRPACAVRTVGCRRGRRTASSSTACSRSRPRSRTRCYGPVPALLPGGARGRRDRDATCWSRWTATARTSPGRRAGRVRTEGGPETETVEGGHDDVHKTREGGLDRRSQTRAEDSWERNAEAVAAVLDKRVAERSPDLVLLTGDVRAVALVCEDASAQHDARAARRGARRRARRRRQPATRSRRRWPRRWRRSARGVARPCWTGSGRRRVAVSGAVTTLDDVIEVLRRGQVAELVLHVDALVQGLAERTLWVGTGAAAAGDERGRPRRRSA